MVELIGKSLKGLESLVNNQNATPVSSYAWFDNMWHVIVRLP